MEKEKILGFDVCISDKEDILNSIFSDYEKSEQNVIVNINPEIVINNYKDKEFVEFHYAVTIKVGSLEEAILLATAIVGEENIVYYDLNSNGMQLSYSKK